MNKLMIVGIVLIFCILMVVYTQIDAKSAKGMDLKEQLQLAFPEYKVIDKYGTWVIGLENQRQYFEERVIIRIDPAQDKNIRHSGQTKILTYSKQPTLRQIKKDIANHLA
mgnify:CR=1 FL=1